MIVTTKEYVKGNDYRLRALKSKHNSVKNKGDNNSGQVYIYETLQDFILEWNNVRKVATKN